jgi:hypothetical protein
MPGKVSETAGLPNRVGCELVKEELRREVAAAVQCLVKVCRVESLQPPDALDVFQPLYAPPWVRGNIP